MEGRVDSRSQLEGGGGQHGDRSVRQLVTLYPQSGSREMNAGAQLMSSSVFSSKTPAHRTGTLTVRFGLLTSVNLIWKLSCWHAQEPVSIGDSRPSQSDHHSHIQRYGALGH